MHLHLQVQRGEDNRLSGTVRVRDASESREFSGTLELMRAFEELVPVQASASEVGGDAGSKIVGPAPADAP